MSFRPNTPTVNPEPSWRVKHEAKVLDSFATKLYGRPYGTLDDKQKLAVHEAKIDAEEAEYQAQVEADSLIDMELERRERDGEFNTPEYPEGCDDYEDYSDAT